MSHKFRNLSGQLVTHICLLFAPNSLSTREVNQVKGKLDKKSKTTLAYDASRWKEEKQISESVLGTATRVSTDNREKKISKSYYGRG